MWPTVPSLVAQITLSLIYICGALYVFVVRPRIDARQRAPRAHGAPAAT